MKKYIVSVLVLSCFLQVQPTAAQLTFQQLSVLYDSAWTYQNLELLPVRFKTSGDTAVQRFGKSFLNLHQALETGRLSIREMDGVEGPNVHVLEIRNRTGKTVLIQSGELLRGGKQDRVFAGTTLVPPGKEINYQDVYCVEKGRWNNRPEPFLYAGMADCSLRKLIDVAPRQNEIWHEIDEQYLQLHQVAETWPYPGIIQQDGGADSGYLNFFHQKLRQSDSAFAGFVAISGKRIIACELFGNTAWCTLSFDGMLSSYLRTVSKKTDLPALSGDSIRIFLDKFLENNEQQERYLSRYGRIYQVGGKILQLIAYDDH